MKTDDKTLRNEIGPETKTDIDLLLAAPILWSSLPSPVWLLSREAGETEPVLSK